MKTSLLGTADGRPTGRAGGRPGDALRPRRSAARSARGLAFAALALVLGASLGGCLGKKKPRTQPEETAEARPTPAVRVTGGEVPPIDRDGAVLELDLPGARPTPTPEAGVGPFDGALPQAQDTGDGTAEGIPGARERLVGSGAADAMGDEVATPEDAPGARVVPLFETTPGMGTAADEEELSPEMQALEREEARPSEMTERFRRQVRAAVDERNRRQAAIEAGEEPDEETELGISGRNIVLNFENVEIRDLILQLQKEGILPLNYILDAAVQGTITIKTADPIAPEDLLDVILTILQANGLTTVKDGNYFRIVPVGDAKSFTIETYVTHSPRVVADINEVVTVIVPLEYISTQQAVSVIDQFKDKDTVVFEYVPGNLLFLTGYSSRLRRLLQILELVDIGTSREELRVYQIYHTSAEELKATIEQIMGSGDFAARFAEAQGGRRRRQQAAAAAGADGGRQPIIIADTRSNRLIAFASKRELEFMERIVELLDQEIVVSDRIYIYYVENADAAQLATTLGAVYGEEGDVSGGASTSRTGAAARTADDPMGGTTQQQQRRPQDVRNRGGRTTDTRQTRPTRSTRPTRGGGTADPGDAGTDATDPDAEPEGGIAYVGEADDEDVAQLDPARPGVVVERTPGARPRVLSNPELSRRGGAYRSDEYIEDQLLREGTGLVSGKINIVADERTNAMIIKTSPANWPIIKETIRKLDVQPKQVLIDVLIAEVTLDETNEFGIEWSILSENSIDNYTFQGTTQTDFGVADQAGGFTYQLLEATRFRGFLRAFANENELEVLSNPHLLASNNTEASFEVGNQIPVVTSQSSAGVALPGQPAGAFFNSIEYRDTGIILSLTPRINAANFVALDVDQEISEAQSNTIGGTDQPIIRQRKVNTSVVVQNGQTLLIGGIMQSSRDISQQNVPWIRRIPVIKHLFGTQKRQVRKTELFIAITPHVIQTPAEADEQISGFKQSLGTQIDQMIEGGGQTRKWWEP